MSIVYDPGRAGERVKGARSEVSVPGRGAQRTRRHRTDVSAFDDPQWSGLKKRLSVFYGVGSNTPCCHGVAAPRGHLRQTSIFPRVFVCRHLVRDNIYM